jgi:hypothetical protein
VNNKLLAIESNEYLQCGTAVKAIDLPILRDNTPAVNMLRIKSIVCQLDERFIIAE